MSLAKAVAAYAKDPVLFCEAVLQVKPDPWQRAVLQDIAKHTHVTVRSGQGVGKTALQSWAILWFLCTKPEARVVATAPTMQQLYDVLWAELAKWQGQSLLRDVLKWTKTKIYMLGKEEVWFATARTAAKPENMQGFHADNLLFVVDEASGVSDRIMEVILGTLTGRNNKLLLCGNPNNLAGTFYDSHTSDRQSYQVHKVSSMDSPRTSAKNIERMIQKYGKDSDVCRIRVFGEFPKGQSDALLSLEAVEHATASIIPESTLKGIQRLHIGCDVARFGDDRTVITARLGPKVYMPNKYQGQDTMETTGCILQMLRRFKQEAPWLKEAVVKVDDTGLGGGVTDRLRELQRGLSDEIGLRITVVPVNNGARAQDEHYANLGAELWGRLRDAVEDNLSRHLQGDEVACIALPPDAELIAELTGRKYRITSAGRIALEKKDDYKKRAGGASPDTADSVSLAWYEPREWLY